MALPFIREFDAVPGAFVPLTPLIGRVLAPNPGPFTFKGTGVYIVGAGPDVAVIDPGPLIPSHVEALKRALDDKRVSHILVTHTHSDHSPAAAPLKEWSGAKTYAFGPHGSGLEDGVKMEEGADRDVAPDSRVKDGDIIAGKGFTVECVYTPGHTSNHMCFALKEEQALFS